QRWLYLIQSRRMGALVLLLPHGLEGQGPEHSSARPERFLQLCANYNMYVINPTTPANFFHALRRQIKNDFRKPLVIFTPKNLFRHPRVISSITELQNGCFREIIDEHDVAAEKVEKVIFCTGKIYYELLDYREKNSIEKHAVIRLEQLYPLPGKQLQQIKEKYRNASKWLWVQEEPLNMGAWSHINTYLAKFELQCIARKESCITGTFHMHAHRAGQEEIVINAFKK
ncbi:2-oxoglutarate dehydrogenase E1 component, partial [Candidatus Riflebacteria bacterium]